MAEYWKIDVALVERYIHGEQLKISWLYYNGKKFSWLDGYNDTEVIFSRYTPFGKYIRLEDAEYFEELHGQASVDTSLGKILNPDHPWHSENLALAIKAWLKLYSNREGNKYDNTYKSPGGNTKLIGEWLRDNVKGIGKSTEEHFRVIINPSKQGGAKKIPE